MAQWNQGYNMSTLCAHCGAGNRDSARHCQVCGRPLAIPNQTRLPAPGPAHWPPQMPALAFPPGQAKLIAETGLTHIIQSPLTKVGRAPDNDIVLTNNQTSSYHAQIISQGDQHMVTDQGSTNGTWLNGQRLTTPTRLHSGDRLSFASEKFTFQSGPVGTVIMTSSPQTNLMPVRGASIVIPSQADVLPRRGFFEPRLIGHVTNVNPPQQEQPPTDPARVLVMIAISLGFVGILLSFAMVELAAGIILLICGGAALLFILPFLLIPFQMLYSGMMSWLKDDKPVLAMRFAAEDETNHLPVDVLLLLKPGTAGSVLLGDRVMVWGKASGASLRATKVTVVERNGHVTNIPMPAKKPWPIWIGLFVLAGVVAGLIYLALSLGLI
jgi:hypothetical protein